MSEEQTSPLEGAVPPATLPRPGRYEGANPDAGLVLRIDAATVSADVYRNPSGRRDWVASLRTAPGASLARAPLADRRRGCPRRRRDRPDHSPWRSRRHRRRGAAPRQAAQRRPGQPRHRVQRDARERLPARMGIEIETEQGVAPIARPTSAAAR